jgi:diguanylate cyclase (GGDEF)-like protein/PAS domain S-box-containing protein
MQNAQIPADEAKRLLALHAARILDTPPEEIFDRLTRLASKILNVPIALISLIDENRQWFKSKVGIDVDQTHRDISFCGHAIHHSEPLHIADASCDPRFSDNPLVTGPPYIRFYCGVPLLSLERQSVGTLCLIDRVPRKLSELQMEILADLAHIAEELFQRRQLAINSADILHSLRESEERYRELVEYSPDVFFIHDGTKIEFINQAGVRLLGAENRKQIIGRSVYDIIAPAYRDIVHQRIINALQTSEPNAPFELEWRRFDGSLIDVEVSTICLLHNGRRVIQVVARDNTARKRYQKELEHLATCDVLTGLPNRAVLRDRLDQGVARWRRQNQEAVVAFLDMDRFKHINDTFGHSTGDYVLTTLAKILLSSVRKNDTVARIGGDEFVLVLEVNENEEEPVVVLHRLLLEICRPIQTAAQEITISCSIGYCRYPADGLTSDALLNAADTAMYRAKDLGRATISAYNVEMYAEVSGRMTMENRLRLALKNDEFLLHYQPKVSLRTGTIVGLEALVRWQSPEFGLVPPIRFISIAEESGIIVPLGEWILRTACEQTLRWNRNGIADMPVAINLSARQFLQPDLVARIQAIIQTIDLPPHLLELELTESLSMGSPEKSVALLSALKDLGITLTLDDFGTGYSNLSYLARFPLDKLKLDQSFVRDIAHSPEALAISQTVIKLAHSLNLKVVAEGVETKEQSILLEENGCDEIQGYLFSKPLNVENCTNFLKAGPKLK